MGRPQNFLRDAITEVFGKSKFGIAVVFIMEHDFKLSFIKNSTTTIYKMKKKVALMDNQFVRFFINSVYDGKTTLFSKSFERINFKGLKYCNEKLSIIIRFSLVLPFRFSLELAA